jgi:hypothetical protein
VGSGECVLASCASEVSLWLVHVPTSDARTSSAAIAVKFRDQVLQLPDQLVGSLGLVRMHLMTLRLRPLANTCLNK